MAAGTFVAPFKRERMTWIKPSFLWMMYRCGWATNPGQERVLAVRMSRDGFESALRASCLSHFERGLYADAAEWREKSRTSPVRVQWDPERAPEGQPLPWRSLQVGLGGSAAHSYVDEWIVGIDDITDVVRRLRGGERALLPVERAYPLPEDVARTVGATAEDSRTVSGL